MNSYKRALYVAAKEAYESEVVQTEMESSVIGEWKEYETKEDWIEARVQYWINEADNERAE